MAPTIRPNASSSTSTLSMKLLVNTKAGRVLYAEASKEVVDFLFSLLTLPVGAVVKVLSKDAMVGCIGNLYGSVEEMDSSYIRCADARNALLSPPGGYGSGTRLLHLQAAAAAPAPALKVYECGKRGHDSCYNYVTVARSAPCRHCRGKMNVPIEVVGFSDPSGVGFVKEVVTYTVMDDLKVEPMSAVSAITLLNTLGVTDISSLQEMTVRVGYAEGLEMLRASLQSKAVLTDVFLRKTNRRQQAVPAASNKKRKLKATTLNLSKAMLIDVFLRKKSRKAPSKKKKGKSVSSPATATSEPEEGVHDVALPARLDDATEEEMEPGPRRSIRARRPSTRAQGPEWV